MKNPFWRLKMLAFSAKSDGIKALEVYKNVGEPLNIHSEYEATKKRY